MGYYKYFICYILILINNNMVNSFIICLSNTPQVYITLKLIDWIVLSTVCLQFQDLLYLY